MRGLYKFELDAGRMGVLSGLFIADEELINRIAEEEFYAMDVLGKHSEVWGKVQDYTELILSDPDVISSLESALLSGSTYDRDLDVVTISGFNPIHYIDEDILYEITYGEEA